MRGSGATRCTALIMPAPGMTRRPRRDRRSGAKGMGIFGNPAVDLRAVAETDRRGVRRPSSESETVVVSRAPGEDLRPILERDGVLVAETPPFQLSPSELELIERHWSDGRSKNSSYNPHTGEVDGVLTGPKSIQGLRALMERYAVWSTNLIAEFFPAYHASLELGRTSLRRR